MVKRCFRISLAFMLFLSSCTTGSSESTDALPASSAVASPAASIVFGVFPYLPTAQLDEAYGPLVRELGVTLGMTVRLRSTSSFETFADALAAGVVALAQPVDSVAVIARPDFDPDLSLRVQEFLLGLDDDPDLRHLLDALEIPRYVPIASGDYERIRELIAMRASE